MLTDSYDCLSGKAGEKVHDQSYFLIYLLVKAHAISTIAIPAKLMGVLTVLLERR